MLAQPVTMGTDEPTAPPDATGVCIRSYRPSDARRDQATCRLPSLPRADPRRAETFSCPLVRSERHAGAPSALPPGANAITAAQTPSITRAGAPSRRIRGGSYPSDTGRVGDPGFEP